MTELWPELRVTDALEVSPHSSRSNLQETSRQPADFCRDFQPADDPRGSGERPFMPIKTEKKSSFFSDGSSDEPTSAPRLTLGNLHLLWSDVLREFPSSNNHSHAPQLHPEVGGGRSTSLSSQQLESGDKTSSCSTAPPSGGRRD